jgi:hypothetical protein
MIRSKNEPPSFPVSTKIAGRRQAFPRKWVKCDSGRHLYVIIECHGVTAGVAQRIFIEHALNTGD